jgi:hypothetical protein
MSKERSSLSALVAAIAATAAPSSAPLSFVADFDAARWPEVARELAPFRLTKANDAFVLRRGSAVVAFRTTDAVVHGAGFFDPDEDVTTTALIVAIAALTGGRITTQAGDEADAALREEIRRRAWEIADPQVYDLAVRLSLLPLQIRDVCTSRTMKEII